MKAAFLENTKISIRNDYPNPKPGETLVKVRLAGICGTDLEMINGYASFSGVIGHEFVGQVVDSQNKKLVGKRVVGEINVGCGTCSLCKQGLERHCSLRTVLGIHKRDGAFAQYLSLPEKNLHIIPDSISDEQAVFVEPLAATVPDEAVPNTFTKDLVVSTEVMVTLPAPAAEPRCTDLIALPEEATGQVDIPIIRTPLSRSDKLQ